MLNLYIQSLLENTTANNLLNEADDTNKDQKEKDTKKEDKKKKSKTDNIPDDMADENKEDKDQLDDKSGDTDEDDNNSDENDDKTDDLKDTDDSNTDDNDTNSDDNTDDFNFDDSSDENDNTDSSEDTSNPDGLPDPDDDGSSDIEDDTAETNLNVNILNLSKLDRVLAKRKCLNDFMELRATITTTRNMIDRTEALLDAEVRNMIIEKINLLSSSVDDYLKIKFKFINYEENLQNYLLFVRYLNDIVSFIREKWADKNKRN